MAWTRMWTRMCWTVKRTVRWTPRVMFAIRLVPVIVTIMMGARRMIISLVVAVDILLVAVKNCFFSVVEFSHKCNVDSWGNRVTINSSKSVTLV